MSPHDTTPEGEKFQLDVDRLEAALYFDDYPAARRKIAEEWNEEYAQRVFLALAARLIKKGRAA